MMTDADDENDDDDDDDDEDEDEDEDDDDEVSNSFESILGTVSMLEDSQTLLQLENIKREPLHQKKNGNFFIIATVVC